MFIYNRLSIGTWMCPVRPAGKTPSNQSTPKSTWRWELAVSERPAEGLSPARGSVLRDVLEGLSHEASTGSPRGLSN